MTNILKDLGKDLSIGRCYLPKERLEPLEITMEELTQPSTLQRLRPLIAQLTWHTLEHLDQACQYVLQLPSKAWRLRLSCMWPLLFAVQTLEIMYRSEVLLDPEARVKISRGVVYRTMAQVHLVSYGSRHVCAILCLPTPALDNGTTPYKRDQGQGRKCMSLCDTMTIG